MTKHEEPIQNLAIKFILSLMMILMASCISHAASPIYLNKKDIVFDYNKNIDVFLDTFDTELSLNQIKRKKFVSYDKLEQQLNPNTRYWAKYQFVCKDAGEYYFYFGKGEHITVHVIRGNGKYFKKEIGEFTPRSRTDVKSISKSAMLSFKKGEKATIYAQIYNETNYPPRVRLDVRDGETFQKEKMFKRLGWQALFHGAIWMMILYNLFLWFAVGDRAYLLYALYMFVLSLTFFLQDQIHYHVLTGLAEYPKAMHFLELFAGQLSIIIYFRFMQRTVNTRELVPFWHQVTKWWIIVKMISLPFLIWYNTYHVLGDPIMYALLFIDLALLLMTCIILIFKKDKVAVYFGLGSIILSLCGLLSILNWQGILQLAMLEQLIQVGIIAQIIIFSMGLGYKTRRNASLVFELQKQNEDLVSELKSKVNEQEKTLRLFMRYVPEPVVAKALNKVGNETIFDGELRYVTAMFCDVRGFTTISEELKPRQVVGFLNDFYSIMTVVIKKYGGSVNQFIGDEIFAVFGAPLSTSNNEQRAVLAALEMVEKVKYLNEKYQSEFKRPIHVGIGLNAGEVVAGNLGSEEKIGYSVTGDAVNTAKRIEGLTKSVPNSIIVSENVYKKVAPLIHVEALEEVSVRGKKVSLRTYRVLGKK